MRDPKAITVHDVTPQGYLAFDLIELLQLVEDEVRTSTWWCCYVECTGKAADELNAYAGSESSMTGWALWRIAARLHQTIWGDFWGYHLDDEKQAWLLLRAIDSSYFAVVCEDEQILSRFRRHFRDVRDSPQDADFARSSRQK